MRLNDLLGAEVRDGNNRLVGKVQDVRLVQDGPEIEGFGPALRIQGILVGPPTIKRLGLTRSDVKGPLALKWLARSVERRLRFVDWDQVRSVKPNVVEIRAA